MNVLKNSTSSEEGAADYMNENNSMRFFRRRSIRQTVAARPGPTVIIVAILVAAFLAIFVALPIIRMLFEPAAKDWSSIVSSTRLHKTALNTLIIGVLSTFTATLLGFVFAYGLSRPDMPFRRFFRWMAILPLISPPFVVGLALLLLFGKRGVFTHQLLGLDLDLLGLPALWVVQTIAFFPIAVLTLRPILQQQGGRFEWVAADLGLGWWATFRRITLPLSTPGLVSAVLLVAMYVLADFGNPMIVGGKFNVLSVEAYVQAIGRFDLGAAAIVSVVLFIPAIVLFIVQRRITKKNTFTAVSGKASDLNPPPMPRIVRSVLLVVMGIVSLGMATMYGGIIIGSFVKAWGADWSFTLDHWTFTVLKGDDLWNSFRFSVIAAVGASVFAVISAWIIHRGRIKGIAILDSLAILPAAIPGTMVGISWLILFNEPPFLLAGTGAILILVMLVRTIPVGYRTAVGSLQQIGPSFEEASADLGAGRLETFVRIIFPMLGPAAGTAFIFSFLNSLNTLSAVVFLISPGRQLGSTSIVSVAEFGEWGQATALASALIFLALIGLTLFKLIAGRKRGQLFDI